MQIITEKTVAVFNGREYPVIITRYIGRATYDRDGETIVADELHIMDYGQKEGVTRTYVHYPENEAPENHNQCVAELKRIATQTVLECYKE